MLALAEGSSASGVCRQCLAESVSESVSDLYPFDGTGLTLRVLGPSCRTCSSTLARER